jgi:hypothetical protein
MIMIMMVRKVLLAADIRKGIKRERENKEPVDESNQGDYRSPSIVAVARSALQKYSECSITANAVRAGEETTRV